ncbi:formin y 2 domain containing 1 [Trapelia coarctata]|nr:formin y 2 domain containing 1 [Trapelia coarctata]
MSTSCEANVGEIPDASEFSPLPSTPPIMASERASPTDTIATTTLSSDSESSGTLVLTAMTMNQVEEKPGLEKPIVKLLPRPSTAPPAIQTPPTIPTEPLPNDAAPNPAVVAPVESTLDAKADVNAVTTSGNEIFIDETTTLTGLPPVYPISRRALQELQKGPKMCAYVGTGPDREYIFDVPKTILSYFSPTLRPLIHNSTPKSVLLLEKADKKATTWLLRWMLNGGVEKSYDNAPPAMNSAIDWAVHRLAVVTGFGVQGVLHDRLVKEVQKHILQGAIKAPDLTWIYRAHVPLPVKQLGKDIAFFIVNSVLGGGMTSPIESATHNAILKADVMEVLEKKRGKIYHMQRVARQPLTVFQVGFIYFFTSKESELRKMVTRDLLWLIDTCVISNDPYKAFAHTNTEFDADMSNASDEAKARRAEYYRGQREAGNAPQQGRRVTNATNPKTGLTGTATYATTAATASSAAPTGPAANTVNAGPGAPPTPLSTFPIKTARPRQRAPRGPKRPSGLNNQAGPAPTSSNVPTGPRARNNPRAPKGPKAQQAPKNQPSSSNQPGACGQAGPSHQPARNTQHHLQTQPATKTKPTSSTPTAIPTNRAGIIFTVSPDLASDVEAPAQEESTPVQTFGTRIESKIVLRITGDGRMEREK